MPHPPHDTWHWVHDAGCVQRHEQIIAEQSQSIALWTTQRDQQAACILPWQKEADSLEAGLPQKRAGVEAARTRMDALAPVVEEHKQTAGKLQDVYNLMFSSQADWWREIVSYLALCEADLAARAAELTAELAALTDPQARWKVQVQLDRLDLIRVLRHAAPPGVPLLAYIRDELKKPDPQSAIQEEDRIFLQTIVDAADDADVALAMLKAEIKVLADVIRKLTTKIDEARTQIQTLNVDIAADEARARALRHDVDVAVTEVDRLQGLIGQAAGKIAGEKRRLDHESDCWTYQIT